MAAIKGTHSPKKHTRQGFPEVKDKMVDNVELSAEPGYYGVTIRFRDKTALTFAIEPSLIAFPVFTDWRSGEEKPLKRYRRMHSKILKM
jgi:hypothetical protein